MRIRSSRRSGSDRRPVRGTARRRRYGCLRAGPARPAAGRRRSERGRSRSAHHRARRGISRAARAAWRGSSSRSARPRRSSPGRVICSPPLKRLGRRPERLVEPRRVGERARVAAASAGGTRSGGPKTCPRQQIRPAGEPSTGQPRGAAAGGGSSASEPLCVAGLERLEKPAGRQRGGRRDAAALGELERDQPAERVARDVRALEPELVEEPARRGRSSDSTPAGVPAGGIGEAPKPGQVDARSPRVRARGRRAPAPTSASGCRSRGSGPAARRCPARCELSSTAQPTGPSADAGSVQHERTMVRRIGQLSCCSVAEYRCTKRQTSTRRAMASTEEAVGTEQRHAPGAGARATCGCTSPACRAYEDHEVPIIVRGEGCYVYDEHGNRYLDGLSALFCVNIGHGRADIAQAGADQAKELGFFTNWSYAHPPRDRAGRPDRVAGARRSEPRVLHQRRQRGRRVGAEARAPVPQAHRQAEQDQGDRARDRLPRHDASGALSATGITALRDAVRAADPGRLPRPQHQHLPAAAAA